MRVLVGTLLLLLCAWGTAQRAQAWRSDEALWAAALRTSPELPRPAMNLAIAKAQAGHWPEAVALTERALLLVESEPRHAWLHDSVCHLRSFVSVFGEPGQWPAWCAS